MFYDSGPGVIIQILICAGIFVALAISVIFIMAVLDKPQFTIKQLYSQVYIAYAPDTTDFITAVCDVTNTAISALRLYQFTSDHGPFQIDDIIARQVNMWIETYGDRYQVRSSRVIPILVTASDHALKYSAILVRFTPVGANPNSIYGAIECVIDPIRAYLGFNPDIRQEDLIASNARIQDIYKTLFAESRPIPVVFHVARATIHDMMWHVQINE